MKISVFGTGYVGLVSGVCFAEMGNEVICVDLDDSKIAQLSSGISPIYEPGLEDLLSQNIKNQRISFTTDAQLAVASSQIIFIAVGTPPQADGSADISYVLKAAETIAENMTEYKLIINKSTVPIGTQIKVKEIISKTLKDRKVTFDYDVASNPEFLREGCAIEDCLKPNRVVIGTDSNKATEILTELYDPFLKNGNPLLAMDPLSSEMTKYAANAMLATKISLMNEFSRVCEKVGANIESVRRGIGTDNRIGPHFIYAGIGYGGSCFPKDVSALVKIGDCNQEDMQILKAVEATNQIQQQRFFEKILTRFGNTLSGKHFAIWGVAFKPGTDDIREAPAIRLIENLINHGATVIAYDPVAAGSAQRHFGNFKNLTFLDDQYDILKNADALCIPTEWKSFKEPDFNRIKSLLREPVIFDGRNLYQSKTIKKYGIEYFSIGRPS